MTSQHYMDTNPYIELAIDLIHRCHFGKVDKSGRPFIMHPIRVAAYLDADTSNEVVAAALMHDVVEDTTLDVDSLRVAGYSDRIADLVDYLTRRPEETYKDYIKRVSEDSDATKIKLADLKDNMDPLRATTSEIQSLISKRYVWARDYLLDVQYKRSLKELKDYG